MFPVREDQEKSKNRYKSSIIIYENNVPTPTTPATSSESEEITAGSDTPNIYEKLGERNEEHIYQHFPHIYENFV